jgi:hypothetical protein
MISKFTKDPCLCSKDGDDKLDRVAFLDLLGKGAVNWTTPRFVFVVLESGIEDGLESGG